MEHTLAEKPVTEKEAWLGLIEGLVLMGTNQLTPEEETRLGNVCDLDEFYQAQSPDVRKAIDSTIAVNGNGLDALLSALQNYELV